MKKVLYLFILLLSFTWACKKTDVDTFDFGYDYYPIETGKYMIYKVEEILYDDFNDTIVTSIYQFKEKFDSSFIDNEGRTIYKLKRYIGEEIDSVLMWNLKDVWTVYKGKDRVDVVEENVTMVKLVFPLKRGKSWDGNARNDSTEKKYTILDYDLKTTIGGKSYISTCRVNEKENINLIEDQLEEEVYARDVGLVYRVRRDIVINPSDSSYTKGYDITWSLIETGLE